MPTPTPQEIETTREVLALSSYTDAAARIAVLEEVQWAAQKDDNDIWEAEANAPADNIKRVGEIEFFEQQGGDITRSDKIRIRSRIRFGLSEGVSGGEPIITTLRYF